MAVGEQVSHRRESGSACRTQSCGRGGMVQQVGHRWELIGDVKHPRLPHSHDHWASVWARWVPYTAHERTSEAIIW